MLHGARVERFEWLNEVGIVEIIERAVQTTHRPVRKLAREIDNANPIDLLADKKLTCVFFASSALSRGVTCKSGAARRGS